MTRLICLCHMRGQFATPDNGEQHRRSPGDAFLASPADAARPVSPRAAEPAPAPNPKAKAKAKTSEG